MPAILCLVFSELFLAHRLLWLKRCAPCKGKEPLGQLGTAHPELAIGMGQAGSV